MTTKDVNAAIWAIEAPESVKRGILGPMYTRSLDASMAVIQRRWPCADVGVWSPEGKSWRASISEFADGNCWPIVEGVVGDTAPHALALALLAALEAETEP